MVTYRVTFELKIADTDAPPCEWLPFSMDQLLEIGESVEKFTCEDITK